jgi:hypothetical protein
LSYEPVACGLQGWRTHRTLAASALFLGAGGRQRAVKKLPVMSVLEIFPIPLTISAEESPQ